MEQLDNQVLILAAAFIILGATGTFLLLPHQHGRTKPKIAHRVGFGMMLVAVLAFVTLWKVGEPTVPLAFFYGFGIVAIGSAVFTITSKNPIHSALWFASVVLATAGLFLLSGAQFLAAGTIIVYAGAIIVTFLFVIMLAQMEGRATYDRMARSPFFATFSAFLMLFSLTYAILALRLGPHDNRLPPKIQVEVESAKGKQYVLKDDPRTGVEVVSLVKRIGGEKPLTDKQKLVINQALPPGTAYLPEATGKRTAADRHVAGLGATLYTEHLVTVELAGTLLFAALIGALAIATPKAPIRPIPVKPSSLEIL